VYRHIAIFVELLAIRFYETVSRLWPVVANKRLPPHTHTGGRKRSGIHTISCTLAFIRITNRQQTTQNQVINESHTSFHSQYSSTTTTHWQAILWRHN